MPKKLGVCLLSYNRPTFVQEAINSILAQDYDNFELIISENSTDDSVMTQLKKYLADPRVKIVKRSPSLPSLAHFNTLFSEVKNYEYAMLFHDDDVLLPTALTKMMSEIEKNPDFSAVGCNAFLTKNTENTNTLFNPNLNGNIIIKSQTQLINRYIFKKLSHTPFPSYIYRTNLIGTTELNPANGGKYSDVSFLVNVIRHGPFVWLSEPLMRYRQHSSNDSIDLNLADIFSISRFFFKTCPHLILNILFYYAKHVGKKIFS